MGGRLKSLVLTANRRTILSVRPGRSGDRSQLSVRIHQCFLDAPPETLEAVAIFLTSRRGTDQAREALRIIRQHFSEKTGNQKVPRTRRPALRPAGVAVDLREIAADLNARYFQGRLAVNITWGRGHGTTQPCRRRTHTSSLQLGSYSYEDNLIRLHGVLDQPGVPRYVIEAVVYHELLHADMPPVVHKGRRYFHTPEFRRRERLYRHLDKANGWIQEHLPELLRDRQATRTGKSRPRRRA